MKNIVKIFLVFLSLTSCNHKDIKKVKLTNNEIGEIIALVKNKNIKKATTLIVHKDLNVCDSTGVSLLSKVILINNFEFVKILIENGANPNLRNKTKSKSTPLMMCANINSVSTATYLIKKGARVDDQDSNGDAVINWAAYMGAYSLTELLLNKGANTNLKSIHFDNTMGVALKEWQDSIVDLLIVKKRGIFKIEKTEKPLIHAIKSNNFQLVKKIVTKDNINSIDEASNSILIIAANKGYFALVKFLIDNGAEIDKLNSVGHTALNKAVWSKKNNVANYLISKGADINKTDNRFILPPLVAAIRSNNIEMVKILLEKGAKYNVKNGIDNFTPIMWAAAYNREEIVTLILKYQPDLKVISKYKTDVFQMTKNKNILQMLKENNNTIN